MCASVAAAAAATDFLCSSHRELPASLSASSRIPYAAESKVNKTLEDVIFTVEVTLTSAHSMTSHLLLL